jgi:LacI family transcriptional regulator
MRDVASLAGVSVGTVSNVLNAPDRVSGPTRERVRAAIDQLGWTRNESARQLRAGQSQTIGIVVMDIGNPYFADVCLGAEDTLYAEGYSVYIGNSDQQEGREELLLRHFEQYRVRGVILAPIGDDECARGLRRRGIPVVMIDRSHDNDFCQIGLDDIAGGRLAVSHLLQLGHRRLAIVGGPSALAQVRDRRVGAATALRQAAADATLLSISTPTLTAAPGVAVAGQIAAMAPHERPTAVFACNDLLAIGLLQGFVAAGLRVPEDLALIGYDDIAFAAAAAVPLSSVRQPRREIGARAAALLLAEMAAAADNRPHRHESVLLAPELVPRQSTAPVR